MQKGTKGTKARVSPVEWLSGMLIVELLDLFGLFKEVTHVII